MRTRIGLFAAILGVAAVSLAVSVLGQAGSPATAATPGSPAPWAALPVDEGVVDLPSPYSRSQLDRPW